MRYAPFDLTFHYLPSQQANFLRLFALLVFLSQETWNQLPHLTLNLKFKEVVFVTVFDIAKKLEVNHVQFFYSHAPFMVKDFVFNVGVEHLLEGLFLPSLFDFISRWFQNAHLFRFVISKVEAAFSCEPARRLNCFLIEVLPIFINPL